MNSAGSVSCVVFDMDGVLVDTSPCHAEAYRRLWEKLELPQLPYHDLAGRSTKGVIDAYCAHLSPESRKQIVADKQGMALELLMNADIVFSDTIRAVKALHRRKLTLGLATSASQASANLVLERLGIGSLFDAVITADQVSNAKPDPELFVRAMNSLGALPSTAIVVEDSKAGIQAGLAAGAKVVNVRNKVDGVNHDCFLGYCRDLNELTQRISSSFT